MRKMRVEVGHSRRLQLMRKPAGTQEVLESRAARPVPQVVGHRAQVASRVALQECQMRLGDFVPGSLA